MVGFRRVVFRRGVSVGVDEQKAVLGVSALMAPFSAAPEVSCLGCEFRVCGIGVVGSYNPGCVNGRAVRVGDCRRRFEEGDFAVRVTIGQGLGRRYYAMSAPIHKS